MTHEIPKHVKNRTVEHCIDEYVRLRRDRAILRDHWFDGVSFMALADKYNLSLTAVKDVVYDVGDPIILMAVKITETG